MIPGCTAYTAEVPVTVTGGKLSIHMKRTRDLASQELCGWALLDPKVYKEKTKSKEYLAQEAEAKQKVSQVYVIYV